MAPSRRRCLHKPLDLRAERDVKLILNFYTLKTSPGKRSAILHCVHKDCDYSYMCT